jgi:hypothetical protein
LFFILVQLLMKSINFGLRLAMLPKEFPHPQRYRCGNKEENKKPKAP